MRTLLITIAAESRQKIKVLVSATADDGSVVDPTADTVEFAFTSDRTVEPGVSDWVAGSWATEELTRNQKVYRAVCLVGPGGTIELAAGRWFIWIRVTDSPEIPVLFSGELQVGF